MVRPKRAVGQEGHESWWEELAAGKEFGLNLVCVQRHGKGLSQWQGPQCACYVSAAFLGGHLRRQRRAPTPGHCTTILTSQVRVQCMEAHSRSALALEPGKLASPGIPCRQPFHPAGTSPELPGFSRQLRELWNASDPGRLPGEETGVAQEPIGLALEVTSPTSLEDWPLTRASRFQLHPSWSTWVVETAAPKLSTPNMAKQVPLP